MIKEQKISDFLTDLASKKPAPGGGSASAMAGAIAAALVVMVCEITIGRKKYHLVEESFKKLQKEAQDKLTELTQLIEEDTEAYLQVVKTKGSQAAVKKAAEVPLQTARASLSVLKMASYASEYGNQNCRSDAFCAIELAASAIYGALENVRANLPFIKDKNLTEKMRDAIEEVLQNTPSASNL